MNIYPRFQRILTVSIDIIDVLKLPRVVLCVPAGLTLAASDFVVVAGWVGEAA